MAPSSHINHSDEHSSHINFVKPFNVVSLLEFVIFIGYISF